MSCLRGPPREDRHQVTATKSQYTANPPTDNETAQRVARRQVVAEKSLQALSAKSEMVILVQKNFTATHNQVQLELPFGAESSCPPLHIACVTRHTVRVRNPASIWGEQANLFEVISNVR